jgi:hypothetical protein
MKRFSDSWQAELTKRPAIAYFKHHEAKGHTGQFEGWASRDCDEKILSLARIIADSDVIYGFITGVQQAAVDDVLNKFAVSAKTFRSVFHVSRPYDWCFHSALKLVFQYQDILQDTDPVDFVFDEGDSAFEDRAKIYTELRDDWPYPPKIKAIAGTVTTGDDKLLPPLQAADLLAGQVTMKLRGQDIEEPYTLLCGAKKIVSMPLRRGDPFLANLTGLASSFNLIWATKKLDRIKAQRHGTDNA